MGDRPKMIFTMICVVEIVMNVENTVGMLSDVPNVKT